MVTASEAEREIIELRKHLPEVEMTEKAFNTNIEEIEVGYID
jgi:hypothetical protein